MQPKQHPGLKVLVLMVADGVFVVWLKVRWVRDKCSHTLKPLQMQLVMVES